MIPIAMLLMQAQELSIQKQREDLHKSPEYKRQVKGLKKVVEEEIGKAPTNRGVKYEN